MDGSKVYYCDQQLVPGNPDNNEDTSFEVAGNKFMHFIRECQVRNTYVYREQLKSNCQRGKYFLKVEMEHLIAFDDPLVSVFRNQPKDYIKVFEDAVQVIYQNDIYDEMDPNLEPSPRF